MRGVHIALENPAGSTLWSFVRPYNKMLDKLVTHLVPRCAYDDGRYPRLWKKYKITASGAWIRRLRAKCTCPRKENGDDNHQHLMRDAPAGRTGIPDLLKASAAYPRKFGKAVIEVWGTAGPVEDRFRNLPLTMSWVPHDAHEQHPPKKRATSEAEKQVNKESKGKRGKVAKPPTTEERQTEAERLPDSPQPAGPWAAPLGDSRDSRGKRGKAARPRRTEEGQAEAQDLPDSPQPAGPWGALGDSSEVERLSEPAGPWASSSDAVQSKRSSCKRAAPVKATKSNTVSARRPVPSEPRIAGPWSDA
jgi:hypothetical protein